jgi:hypothetical protein
MIILTLDDKIMGSFYSTRCKCIRGMSYDLVDVSF